MPKVKREEKWQQMAEATRNEAQKLPYGKDREALESKARQLQTAFSNQSVAFIERTQGPEVAKRKPAYQTWSGGW